MRACVWNWGVVGDRDDLGHRGPRYTERVVGIAQAHRWRTPCCARVDGGAVGARTAPLGAWARRARCDEPRLRGRRMSLTVLAKTLAPIAHLGRRYFRRPDALTRQAKKGSGKRETKKRVNPGWGRQRRAPSTAGQRLRRTQKEIHGGHNGARPRPAQRRCVFLSCVAGVVDRATGLT